MSAGCRRLSSLLLALPLALLLIGRAPARERDALDDVKARRAIEAQRLERQFTDERAAAYRLVRVATPPDSVAAVEKVYTLRAVLRADTSLSPARRSSLIATLESDLTTLRRLASERRAGGLGASRPDSTLVRDARRDADRLRDLETRRPTGGIPRTTIDDVRSTSVGRSKYLADARDVKRRGADGFAGALRDVDKSAVPATEADRFPRDWAEKSRRRIKKAFPMTAREVAIMKALRTVIQADFPDSNLSEVVDWLQKKTGVTINIDKQAMDEAMVSYETKINLNLRATTRTVLKKVLADIGLTYVVKDQMIQITTPARAREMTTVRIYSVADLAATGGGAGGVILAPAFTRFQMIQNINLLINTITQTVEPQSWQVNNADAPGTITFDPIRMALIVKQTAEIHFTMNGPR